MNRPLIQEKFGQIRTILAGNAGNQRFFHKNAEFDLDFAARKWLFLALLDYIGNIGRYKQPQGGREKA